MHLSLNRHSRSRILLGLLLVMGAIFIIRLFIMQVVQHGDYVAKAAETQVGKFTIAPKRGQIYAKDLSGGGLVPLVMNEPTYTAYADPSQIDDARAIESLMKKVAAGNVRDGFADDLGDSGLRYTVLARQLNRTQAELVKKENLAGVGLQETTRRVYPEGSLAAQTLGYVDSEGAGQYGLESYLDEKLTGKAGVMKAVTDVRRIPLTIGNNDVRVAATNGDNVVLNIDRNIQAYAESALKRGLDKAKATTGSVVIIDPHNGNVMAMANYPTFSPGEYYKTDNYAAFSNGVVSDPYEAGSVIKTLTMGAGLDSGAVNYNSTFNNSTGCVLVDGVKICNVEEDPVNNAATMTDTLHYSLNTGVVYILQQMGSGAGKVNTQSRNTLYNYWTDRYQFGKLTGIELPNEQEGVIVKPDSPNGANVQYANMTFGQGMNTTMIQVAGAFSAAINGGTYYKPQLVAGVRNGDGTYVQKQPEVIRTGVLSSNASSQLRQMTYEGRSLGLLGKTDKKGYTVGGKTGTSQIIDKKTGKYSNDNSIGTYLGFGGGSEAEYVIMVRVNDSKAAGYAGTVAAGPIFGDISNWMLDYLQVEPNR